MEDIKLHKNEIELIKSCLETCKSFNIGTGLYDRIIKKMDKALTIPVVVGSAFSDTQLEDMINHWLDHYTANGDSHYSDTKDWKIREIYWDKIISRVIEDVNTEMTDDKIDRFCDRLANL